VDDPAFKSASPKAGNNMKNRLPILALGLIIAFTPRSAPAQVVVSSTGEFDSWIVLYSGQAFGVSWTQATSYDDVSITAELTAFGQTSETGRAFLSTSIGPSATMAGEVAYTAFTFPSAQGDVALFSGLNLPAGQYYLSLVGDSPDFGSGWIASDSPDIETGVGVTLGESYGFVSPGLSYLPSSAVYDGGEVPNFTVAVPAVSETSSYGVFLAASLFIFAFSRTRTGKRAGAEARP